MAIDGWRSNLSPEARGYLDRVEKRLLETDQALQSLRTNVNYLMSRIAQPLTAGLADGSVTDAKVVSVSGSKITGSVNEADHADGVTSGAYSRNAVGSSFFAVWMNSALQLMRNTSSKKFKKNIQPYTFGDRALGLKPVEYDRIGGEHEYGLIAEQVNEHLPEIVTWFPNEDGTSSIDGIRYDLLSVALLDIVKDLSERLQKLESNG